MFSQIESLDTIIRALALPSIAVCWIVFVVRIVGLRAFSKMTAFDFVVTVSIGSLLAGSSQATSWYAFLQSNLAMATLLAVQYVVARLRRSSTRFDDAVQNSPVLLMSDGEFLYSALAATRVAEDDIVAKLRESNVLDVGDVKAVVLETTGDISILHGDSLHQQLLRGVSRID